MNCVAKREPDPCLYETELSGRERHPNGGSFDGTQRVGGSKRMAVQETEKKRGSVNGTSNGEITKQAINRLTNQVPLIYIYMITFVSLLFVHYHGTKLKPAPPFSISLSEDKRPLYINTCR
ncbi:hypothetical protein RJT34_15534 [Clitoria ternatea]|uniref:Uncharacterized protein n=1 Tax=Clitoria ternatea TaxID=43366 RepID=A0AAN9PBI6_CLITE